MKIDKLIEAATKEFAEKGFEKASTSLICERAGVSKGLLFHHFKTKTGLYLSVYEKILASLIEKVDAVTYDGCGSYLDAIIKMAEVKLNYYTENPEAYEILLEASYNTPAELKDGIAKIFNIYVDYDKYFSELAFGQYELRKGIDPKKAWEIVTAVTSLIERKIMKELIAEPNEKGSKSSILKIADISGELFEYFNIIFYGIAARDAQANGWGSGA